MTIELTPELYDLSRDLQTLEVHNAGTGHLSIFEGFSSCFVMYMWNLVSRHGMSLVYHRCFRPKTRMVHLKDFSGTIEVVLQNQTTQITKCRNISYYDL